VEVVAGCEPTGPKRPWIEALDAAVPTPSDAELLDAIFRPFSSPRGLDDATSARPLTTVRKPRRAEHPTKARPSANANHAAKTDAPNTNANPTRR
jgi:hypothetical protein